LWSRDISWPPGPARGTWFYLYLMLDVYSRKIVGHEVYQSETGELASEFIEKAYWREHLAARGKPLVLHSDSRPRVSNDNAYSESLFKTLIRSWLSANRLSRLRRPRTRGAGPVISETSACRNQ